jgi:hypothetical protein
MRGVGAERTRNTYLAALRPWFGFLSEHQYPGGRARIHAAVFCWTPDAPSKAGRIEGWFVQATNKSPISTNGLHLVIAALRNFYEVMRRGVFNSEDQRLHPLYSFGNPMYSRVLLAWRSEQRVWMRNAGRRATRASVRSRADAAP